jgi:outer membrane protein OmpA-like peptidoglycan-associated protein
VGTHGVQQFLGIENLFLGSVFRPVNNLGRFGEILNVYVDGRPDDVGTLKANIKLSQARAESVLQALVQKHGIAAVRPKSFAAGPYALVASNGAEEGRAKDCRAELVKK